jgi:hypothetical protein
MIKRILKIVLTSTLLLFTVLIVLILDWSPRVSSAAHEQVENAEDVSVLIKQLKGTLRDRYATQQIEVTRTQADSLIGFAQRALPKLAAEIELRQDSAIVNASYKLPSYLLGTYLNVSFIVLEHESLLVDSVQIGDITLPGSWVVSWAESGVNAYTKSAIASTAIQQISKVEINPQQVSVSIFPIDTLLKELKSLSLSTYDDSKQLLRIKTAHYLRLLMNLGEQQNSNSASSARSLSFYLHHLMKEAKFLSQDKSSQLSNSATLENEAALYALAIYAGSRRFSSLVGDLSFAIGDTPIPHKSAVLANRKDLSLHFIFSSVIKLMSEQGISNAVGEFKELMDRGEGGSGYSFVDLAADMAGANFAALAVNPNTAIQLQDIMSLEANEMLFFPSIEGLDEGMGKTEFKQKYDNVESETYKRVVETINSRINRLPIGSIP